MMQRREFTWALLGAAAWAPAAAWARPAAMAQLGLPVPSFTLNNTSGQPVSLSQFRGRPVVLEWVNPDCPFVRKHYQGNMQGMQRRHTAQGVTWLTISSTHPGSPDHYTGAELAHWMRGQQGAPTAILMDEDGQVGRSMGARVTPHLFIINAQGVLVYSGAVDSIASTRVSDIERATNFIDQGLEDLRAGRPLRTPSSQPYGCSIKFAR